MKSQTNSLSLTIEMAPLQLLHFKFKLLFTYLSSNISIPILNQNMCFSIPNSPFFSKIDPSKLSSFHVNEPTFKKPKKLGNKLTNFYDTWVMKFPWAQIILKLNGFVLQVKCVIYSIIEKKDKFLSSKLDTLQKHVCCS
jgi:hypothetical protein